LIFNGGKSFDYNILIKYIPRLTAISLTWEIALFFALLSNKQPLQHILAEWMSNKELIF